MLLSLVFPSVSLTIVYSFVDHRTVCGTPNYIAPEILYQDRHGEGHSFEVDVWSVGVIL